jgi:hypothetical protein
MRQPALICKRDTKKMIPQPRNSICKGSFQIGSLGDLNYPISPNCCFNCTLLFKSLPNVNKGRNSSHHTDVNIKGCVWATASSGLVCQRVAPSKGQMQVSGGRNSKSIQFSLES